MPVFEYTARDEGGQLVQETLPFHDEPALRAHLRRSNLFLVEVIERTGRRTRGGRRKGAGLKNLVVMTRQLRTMIRAGMPLVSGLDALAEQAPTPYMQEVLDQVGRSVGHGNTLASTLAQYPHVFPNLLVALIRSGEEGGRLPESLEEAGRQLELQMEVRQKVISAMVYPMFTLLTTIGTVTAMMLWIVPVFKNIYKDLHAPLPAMTQLLISISDLLVSKGWLVAIALVGMAFALRRYSNTPEGRVRIDGFKLKAPILGGLFLKSASANLTGSLAGLLDSGLPLLQALPTAASVCGNEVLANATRAAAHQVSLGKRLSEEFAKSGQFPIMVTRMISIAEEVGSLPDVLREISASYIEEVEYTIRRVVGLVEPILIFTVGGIVGFVLVALYYPIFNLGNAFIAGA